MLIFETGDSKEALEYKIKEAEGQLASIKEKSKMTPEKREWILAEFPNLVKVKRDEYNKKQLDDWLELNPRKKRKLWFSRDWTEDEIKNKLSEIATVNSRSDSASKLHIMLAIDNVKPSFMDGVSIFDKYFLTPLFCPETVEAQSSIKANSMKVGCLQADVIIMKKRLQSMEECTQIGNNHK